MTKREAADVLEHAIEGVMRATGIPAIVISVDMGDGDHMAWRWPGAVSGTNADGLEDAEVFEDAAEDLRFTAARIRAGKTTQQSAGVVLVGDES